MKTTDLRFKLGIRLGLIEHPRPHTFETPATTLVAGYSVQTKLPMGLDMSKWDPVADYTLISPKPTLVYLRATYGAGYADPMFAKHVAGFRSIGVPLTAYHFFLYTEDPLAQAKLFCSRIAAVGGAAILSFPVVLDIEGALPSGMTPATAASKLGTWISAVRDALGVGVNFYSSAYYFTMLYTGGTPPIWARTIDPATGKLPYFAWAGYPSDPNAVSAMPMYYRAAGITSAQDWLWQYTMALYVSGIEGAQDGNQVLETIDPPTPPGPEPPISDLAFIVVSSSLNVRTGPSTSYQVIGSLPQGAIVTPLDVAGNDAWVQIDLNGQKGWAAVKISSTIFMKKV